MHEALGGGVHVEPRLVLVLALTRLPHQICSLGRLGPGLGVLPQSYLDFGGTKMCLQWLV
jgi:hypothetical protein